MIAKKSIIKEEEKEWMKVLQKSLTDEYKK